MGNMPSNLRRQVYFDKSLEEMKWDNKPTEGLLDLKFENDDHLEIKDKTATRAYHSSKLPRDKSPHTRHMGGGSLNS